MRTRVTNIVRRIEPLRPTIQRYADWRLDQQTIGFMRRFSAETQAESRGKEIGFVIEPWPAATSLPLYIIVLALAFVKRGKRVCFIWRDVPLEAESPTEAALQRRLSTVMAHVPPQVRTIRLSEWSSAGNGLLSEADLRELARLNTFRQFLSESPGDQGVAAEASALHGLRRTALSAEAALRAADFDYLAVPGGLYRTTGMFVRLGKALGIRVASFDSGRDILLVAADGVAAYLDDIPRAFRSVPRGCEPAIQEARAEFARRTEGRDAFSYQLVPAQGGAVRRTILLPLNQSFDAAALGRHRVFSSQTEWMLESVRWILDNTAETVTVRRHPAERFAGMKSHDDYRALLASAFSATDRIVYIPAEAPVSTYDILRAAKLVLTHVSTIGVEAAALGVPVVTQSASSYADLGFVASACTRDDYYDKIRRALAGEWSVSPRQCDDAWVTYYLTQCRNFFRTSVTPNNIRRIVRQQPAEVLSGAALDTVFSSIDTNTPLSLLMHDASMRQLRP